MDAQAFFRARLAPLSGKYAGVLTPEAELGRPKVGVSDFLLGRAEEYFTRFVNYDYIYGTLLGECNRLGIRLEGVAVDIGSGFGNTVIPLLQNHAGLSVIATDISPDLLAILLREATARGARERCAAVALNAHEEYLAPQSVDMAFGNAVLHHLADPLRAVANVLKALKPGGRAVFCEPFQPGHSILYMAYDRVLAEAELRRERMGPGMRFLRDIARDIHVRAHQKVLPDTGMAWEELDDKWLFTKTHFERIAEKLQCANVEVRPQYVKEDMVAGHTANILRDYGQLEQSALPDWAWRVLRRFDEDFLTPELKQEFVLEGIVTITR